MKINRFFTIAAGTLLYSAMFYGNFAQTSLAQVVNAYRKPSEADLEWVLGTADPTPAPNPTDIVQVGFSAPAKSKATDEESLTPCKPVKSPKLPVPPAPKVSDTKKDTGIAPEEEDGVTTIEPNVDDSAAPVVQMAGKQLPPPEVPKEQSTEKLPATIASEKTQKTVEPLPAAALDVPQYSLHNTIHNNRNDISCSSDCTGDSLCTCSDCISCGDSGSLFGLFAKKKRYRSCSDDVTCDDESGCLSHTGKNKNSKVFNVPDMLGSSAWLSDHWVGLDAVQLNNQADYIYFALPTMLLSRPNATEHFNAEVQNRIWADYRHWNNAASLVRTGLFPYYENRAVEQFTFAIEKTFRKKSSVEIRVPVFGQFESSQTFGRETSKSAELGNISILLKHIFRKNRRHTLTGGIGITMPTAEDCVAADGSLRLNNNIYYLVSFLGVQWHPNDKTFGHIIVEADIPFEKNELVMGTDRRSVDGQPTLRTGIQFGRWIYRNDNGTKPCRLGSFFEVDYTVVTDGSSEYRLTNGSTNDSIYVSEFGNRESTLTAAVGVPAVFGNLTLTNSVFLPLSGNDRPFSVGYGLSLNRKF